MKLFTEKESGDFLNKQGFRVVPSTFIKGEKKLDKTLQNVVFPIVMKVSGREIVHKKRMHGVKMDIGSYNSGMKNFNELMNLPKVEEVVVQNQIQGKEFLLGLKKTFEFGHVVGFGHGGSSVEKLDDVSFRVCPVTKVEARKMIRETKIGKNLKDKEIRVLENNLMSLCHLAGKFPGINELDLNPLTINRFGEGMVVDSRILWER